MKTPKVVSWLLGGSILVATTLSVQGAVPTPGASARSNSSEAQEVQIPENLTRDEVRDLLSRLSDDQARALLIRELDKEAVGPGARRPVGNQDTVEQLQNMVKTARLRLDGILASWPKLSSVPGQIFSQATLAGTASPWSIVLGLVLMFAVGWAAEKMLRRTTGIGISVQPRPVPEGFPARLVASLVRAFMRLLALLVFAVAAFAVMCVAVWNNEGAEPLFLMLLSATLMLRAIAIGMDVVLAPRAPGLRLVTLDDDAARTLRTRLLILIGILVVERVLRKTLDLFGVDFEATLLIQLALITLFVIVLIVMLWQARHAYAAIIRGDSGEQAPGESGFVNTLAAYWHLIAIASVLVLFLLALGKLGTQVTADADYPGIKTLIFLMLLPLIDLGMRRIVARLFRPEDEDEQDHSEDERSMLTLAPAESARERESRKIASREIQAVVLKNLRIVLAFIAILVVLGFWGVELGSLAQAAAGERVGAAFFDIVLTAFVAYAIWSVVKAAVSFHMVPEEGAAAPGGDTGGDIGGVGQTRMQTLLPLFRKVIFITLLLMGVLIILSSLGVNIGPLIAGAGVVGLAIGFGAQALVRDIVSGVFFLLDDAFRMGEYVEIDDIRGSVEGISVRSLRLRHHNGPLHTIPFGEIKHLTNYSRDWVVMKFELRLPFETDINKVRKIIKNVGKEMEQDEELAPLMLAPLKSQGVNRMEDSALIIRCKFMALPGQQFYVRREAFTRIQAAFEENGIRFAPKRVIVEAATPALAVAGAAALETEDAPAADAGKSDDRG